jgi:hypothetical protein
VLCGATVTKRTARADQLRKIEFLDILLILILGLLFGVVVLYLQSCYWSLYDFVLGRAALQVCGDSDVDLLRCLYPSSSLCVLLVP